MARATGPGLVGAGLRRSNIWQQQPMTGELINIPRVAGTVLQTPPSLTDSLIESVILFLQIFKTP